MARKVDNVRPRHLRLVEQLQPDSPPRRLSRTGRWVVALIVGAALMAMVLL